MREQHPLGAFIVIDDGLDVRLEACKTLGLPTAQILAPSADRRRVEDASRLLAKFKSADVNITVVFCGFAGESYADIPTVQRTVGLVPVATRQERLSEAMRISDYAKTLGVAVTALHLGFIPETEDDPDYQEIVRITGMLCDHCRANHQALHLETGQEPAEILLKFLRDVNRPNLAVNFDPANMILYGSGEPIPALRLLGSHVKSVHCKDAKWSASPKVEWGQEVPLGEGDVNMKLFLKTLKEIGYRGPLTIEREIAGEQQIRDIQKAVNLLMQLRREFWGE